jgi:GT2 family glycosyltransferase
MILKESNSVVYFIVVSYNSSNFIVNCLNSITVFEPNAKIIVLDNASNDNTVDLVKTFNDVLLMQNKINLGFGEANNIGIEYALKNGADYVYLINHDAYLVESVVDKAIELFTGNPQFGILTPLQVQWNRIAMEVNFARFLSYDGILPEMVNDAFLIGEYKKLYEVPFAQAASWMIKRETLEKVGLFNPLFFHYGEDNEYLNRLKYHGYKLGLIAGSRIVHIANPLNLNHPKNFNQYHRNREFNNWLIKQLDLSIDYSFTVWLRSFLPYLRKLITSMLKLQFLKSFRLVLLLGRMVKVSRFINSSRAQNSKSFNNRYSCVA